ncbi:hypothetical protein DXC10_14250 [Bacteroides sp. OM08-11]|nr:hypothetical protein DXC10_14250 [Bacteroides sp. OM08-11]
MWLEYAEYAVVALMDSAHKHILLLTIHLEKRDEQLLVIGVKGGKQWFQQEFTHIIEIYSPRCLRIVANKVGLNTGRDVNS